MKRVKFLRNGCETVMDDKVAAIYEKKKKVKIRGDGKEIEKKKSSGGK